MKKVLFTALCLMLTITAKTQDLPAYNSLKGFRDYQLKMNAYYKKLGNKGSGYKQWKRLEWYYENRLDADGNIPDAQQLKQTALQKAAAMKQFSINNPNSPNAFTASWGLVGPNNVTSADKGIGRINRLAYHPTDPNTLYVATAGGGLWKTTNGGTSWQALTDGLPNLNLSGVAVHKTNPNIIYILTGDGDATGGSPFGLALGKYSTGVLKTTDGGITWNKTGLSWTETNGIAAYALVMHPSNFNILMVATENGIYRTTDGGVNWTLTFSSFGGYRVFDIKFMPNNGQIVYAGVEGGTLIRSVDGGVSWSDKFQSPSTPSRRITIAVTPAYSTAVYLLIENKENDYVRAFQGIYYSADTGNNFVRRSPTIPNVMDNDGLDSMRNSQGSYNLALAVSPFDQDLVNAAAIRLFRSTNGAQNLSFINNSNPANYHVDVHELSYGPSTNALYMCSDGGIYKSLNDGLSWTSINGNLAITQYYKISVSTSNVNTVLAGAQDNGHHLRTSLSQTFDRVLGADGMDNAISASNPMIMYATQQNGVFNRSSNGGANFSFLASDSSLWPSVGMVPLSFWLTPISVTSTNPNFLYMGYQPLIKAVNSSGVWNFTAVGQNTGNSNPVSGRTLVKVGPGNANLVYAGNNAYEDSNGDLSAAIWRTADGGNTWKRFTAGNDYLLPFTDLAMNPDDHGEIWVTVGRYLADKKVFRSSDSGTTWINITGSLPNVPINCIVYDDNNGAPDDAVYIGTDIGVFYRDNTLSDWIPFSDGLPVVEVTDLEINEANGLLRAGTYGRGVWQTALYSSACLPSLFFSAGSHPPSEPGFFPVVTNIISVAEITGLGANIQYKAGQRVTLNPGFRIDASTGAKFISYLGPCPGGGVPPTYTAPTMNRLSGYLIENK